MENSGNNYDESKDILIKMFLNIDYNMNGLKNEINAGVSEKNSKLIKKYLSDLDKNFFELSKLNSIDLDKKVLAQFRKLKELELDKKALDLTKFL